MKLKKSYLVNFDLIKFNRFFSKFFLFLFSLLLFSCKSAPLPVPGEDNAKRSNIYSEYYNLGERYLKLEDYSNALKYFELAMKNKNIYWAAYYKKAKCHVYLNDWNNALPMYKTLLKRDNENTSIKASIAYIYCMQNDIQNAQKLYIELLDIEPTNKDYLENYLALLLQNEKNFKVNINDFEKKLELLREINPNSDNLIIIEKKYNDFKEIEAEQNEY